MDNLLKKYAFPALCTFCFSFGSPWAQGATTTVAESATAPTAKDSPLNFAFDLQYGASAHPTYKMTEARSTGDLGHTLDFALEWLPLQSVGKMGIGLSLGASTLSNFELAEEKWVTVYTFPIGVHLSYRFDYTQNQFLVPFAKLGLRHTWVRQTSKTGAAKDGVQGSNLWGYSFGLELCLNKLDRKAAANMEDIFGINNTYLVFEYAQWELLESNSTPDLSGANYRAGLRFEF